MSKAHQCTVKIFDGQGYVSCEALMTETDGGPRNEHWEVVFRGEPMHFYWSTRERQDGEHKAYTLYDPESRPRMELLIFMPKKLNGDSFDWLPLVAPPALHDLWHVVIDPDRLLGTLGKERVDAETGIRIRPWEAPNGQRFEIYHFTQTQEWAFSVIRNPCHLCSGMPVQRTDELLFPGSYPCEVERFLDAAPPEAVRCVRMWLTIPDTFYFDGHQGEYQHRSVSGWVARQERWAIVPQMGRVSGTRVQRYTVHKIYGTAPLASLQDLEEMTRLIFFGEKTHLQQIFADIVVGPPGSAWVRTVRIEYRPGDEQRWRSTETEVILDGEGARVCFRDGEIRAIAFLDTRSDFQGRFVQKNGIMVRH